MKQKQRYHNLSLRIDTDLYNKLKVASAFSGLTIQKMVANGIDLEMERLGKIFDMSSLTELKKEIKEALKNLTYDDMKKL